MITIVDYGAGNVTSVRKAFAYLGIPTRVTGDADTIADATSLVLPGVGHFGTTERLWASGVADALRTAIARGVPFLGICVGMQWLYEGSEEAPGVPGLGLIAGMCRRFGPGLKVPHVGWNTIEWQAGSRLLNDAARSSFAYFTHSYYGPVAKESAAFAEYGITFSAVVERGSAFGVQFHPEKSGEAGLRMLQNFARLAC